MVFEYTLTSSLMTPLGQTLCLCMIVKDEAPVIRRCLASVRPLIDSWIVVDTGSTDGTQEIVRAAMADLRGELVERPWVDFAHNRSEALALARPRADYSLIIDADDTLEIPADFQMPKLGADSYIFDIHDANITYRRAQLVCNALAWRYVGVLHEFLRCDEARTSDHLPIVMHRNHDGRRRRAPNTYRNDAATLERALATETDPFLRARYTFYLAQSYRDCGERAKAIDAYLARAELKHWDQEIFVSLSQAGKLMEAAGRPREDILAVYQRASAACPSRAEAAHAASRLCRLSKEYERGRAIAEPALGLAAPADGLFVEQWIYDYGLRDEYGVNAYWAGRYRESADATLAALEGGKVPEAERSRLLRNIRFAVDKLGESARALPASSPSAGWAPSRPQGGTELMVEALRQRLGPELEAIDLRINSYDAATGRDTRPLVLWMHHDIDQAAVQWCTDPELVEPVDCFIFVSHWQRERYVGTFGLKPERCVVVRHAMEQSLAPRRWEKGKPIRCAYVSTPFRGLDLLLDAWERLRPAAELNIWSSMKLYSGDDAPYRHLFERARSMPGVVYRGLTPNHELREALRTIHFLTYPSTFAETACLSVMEAMAAGCRVIVPSFGALPETTAGYARLYPWCADRDRHIETFARTLDAELAMPWGGEPEFALAQQAHCSAVYSWPRRLVEWRRLIKALVAPGPPRRPHTKKVEAKRGTFYVTAGDFISESVANDGDWEPHLYRLAGMVLTETSNVLDLGANFGYHTVGLGRLVPKGLVYAFEPLELCFSQMRMNIEANALENVRAFKVAVTDRSGDRVEMDPLPTGDGDRRLNIGITAIGRGGDVVSTVRLDDMALPRIDFIKADIQGAETEALDGMRQLIAKDRPVLFIEIEEAHLRRRGSSSKILIDRLLSLGYTVARIRTDWPTDHVAIPNERPDLIARVQAEAGHAVDLLAGASVELTFENDYFYSTFMTHRHAPD